MSQSKMDATRSGSAGSNWQLSSLRSLWTIDTRLMAGIARTSRWCSSSIAAGESSNFASSQRRAQPLTWRSMKPSGLPRSARSQAFGSRAWRSAMASTRAKPMRRPTSRCARMDGGHGRADHLALPPLHDEEVGAEHGGVVAEEVGARRAVEVAPQAREHAILALHVVGARRDLAHGRPAQHQLVRAQAQEVREVGGAVGELQDLQRPLDAGEHLGQPRAQPRLQRGPVQLLARTDGAQPRAGRPPRSHRPRGSAPGARRAPSSPSCVSAVTSGRMAGFYRRTGGRPAAGPRGAGSSGTAGSRIPSRAWGVEERSPRASTSPVRAGPAPRPA